MRIALLEDDRDQARLLQLWLEEIGYPCAHFALSRQFLANLKHNSYDLLILDWELPDMSGLEVLKKVRETYDWPIPILFTTQRDDETDVVAALQSGADDYMTKPIKKMEMFARLTALQRRSKGYAEQAQTVTFSPYTLDRKNHVVSMHGEQIKLNHKEYELVTFLFNNIGHVVSRSHLLEVVWGTKPDINTRTVDTHVSRIRNKLALNPENGWRLTSIYQHGYRLEQLAGVNQ